MSSKMILLVDDDASLRKVIEFNLNLSQRITLL